MEIGLTKNLRAANKIADSSSSLEFLKNSFFQHFTTLKDPRVDRTKEHLLIDIMALAILAIISGADGWVAIETYGKAKHEWLKQFLELPNGIPSHDTISRVFARLCPEAFQECFSKWVNEIVQQLGVEVISLDGKTLKQSYDRNKKQKAIHVVSAWANKHKLVLGQKKVNAKSNEITAIPKLIEMLEISGSIITIDALGCQKEIVTKIINKQADYVLGLKGNQGKLHQQVKDYFEQAYQKNFANIEHSYHQEIESGHNRIEKRQVWSIPVDSLPSLHNQNQWKGLKTVVMVFSQRCLWNKTTTEVRFYLSSLESDAKFLARVIRNHWGIENTLHWTLDVTFREDASRIRKDHAPENFALLRRLALNLLNREKTFKGSNRMKRYLAAMDNNYLLKILAASQI